MIVTIDVTKLSDHFELREAVCKDGKNSMLYSKEFFVFLMMLEEFRVWYNRVIIPASWYRTPIYNKSIGGATYSQHMLAIAIDIHFPPGEILNSAREDEFLNNVKVKWFELCDKYGVAGGVFFYKWGFHIDARSKDRRHVDYR